MLNSQPTLGEILQKARLRQELNLEQVEMATHIRPQYIAALEERQYASLPAEIYLMQILKTYCVYLGLDFEAIKELYLKERNLAQKSDKLTEKLALKQRLLPPEKSTFITGNARFEAFSIGPKTMVMGATFLVFSLIAGYIWNMVSDFSSKPQIVITQPTEGVEINVPNVMVSGKVGTSSVLTVDGKEVPVASDGSFELEVALADGLNEINLAAISKVNNEMTQKKLSVLADLPKTATPLINEIALELEATGPSWVHVVTDDESDSAFEGVMESGESQSFKANEKIALVTGNAGDLKIKLNGQEQEQLGAKGEVAKVTFGKEGERVVKHS